VQQNTPSQSPSTPRKQRDRDDDKLPFGGEITANEIKIFSIVTVVGLVLVFFVYLQINTYRVKNSRVITTKKGKFGA